MKTSIYLAPKDALGEAYRHLRVSIIAAARLEEQLSEDIEFIESTRDQLTSFKRAYAAHAVACAAQAFEAAMEAVDEFESLLPDPILDDLDHFAALAARAIAGEPELLDAMTSRLVKFGSLRAWLDELRHGLRVRRDAFLLGPHFLEGDGASFGDVIRVRNALADRASSTDPLSRMTSPTTPPPEPIILLCLVGLPTGWAGVVCGLALGAALTAALLPD